MGVRVREKVEGSGEWWVFVHHRGHRTSRRVGDKRAAERVASGIRERMNRAEFNLPRTGPTFKDVADEWFAKVPVLRSLSPTTVENYRSFTTHHLIPFFGAMPVTSITGETIEKFIALKRGPNGSTRFPGKPLGESSLRTGLVTLWTILQRAVKAKYVSVNPMTDLDKSLRRGDDDNVDPFDGEELRAILTAAQDLDRDFAAMLRLWVQCGMRAGEVCGLQWHDLDLEAGTALVRRTWSRHRLGLPKTRRPRRVSFLHPVAEATGEWHPGATAEARSILSGLRRLTVRSLNPEAFVFGPDGTKAMNSDALNQKWRRVLAKAKVRYREPEQLRHTFASTLLSRNAPLLYVQAQGGWRSAAVLLRVYARWMPQPWVGTLAPAVPTAPQEHPAEAAVAVTR